MRATRHLTSVLLALVFVLSACAGAPLADPEDTTTSTPATAATPSGIPIPDDAVFYDTVGEFCGSVGEPRIEMAFNGIVAGRNEQEGVPWVTFEVDRWYTDDLGTEIALWAPDFDGAVGERWMIASSRYQIGPLASGDVFWCESEPETDELLAEWGDRYGGSVEAGGDETEEPANLVVLAEIDQAEATWLATKPDSYTITIGREDRTTRRDNCGSGLVRVVVTDGVPTEARDVRFHCDVPLADALTVASMFELARDSAGAVQGGIEFDQDFGFIRSFSAVDRSVEVYLWTDTFHPVAIPAASDRAADLAAAQTRWEESGIDSYTFAFDARCFCSYNGPWTATIVDGVVTETTAPNDAPQTIDELFAAITGYLDADNIELAFDPELGYPVMARIDPMTNAIDEEIDFFIFELTPSR